MTCTCPGRNGYSDVCAVHGIAARFPAVTDSAGRTWWRPVRDAGTDLSQWGWTSDPLQAHPAYAAPTTCRCSMTPEHLWTRYGSAVEPGSQWEQNPLCPVHPAEVAWRDPVARTGAAVADAVRTLDEAGLLW
ncbi:hypothetical protein SEA_MARSHAWN_80 [Mycobacterium phage Marshawn]|uniref:Uncharacterized protein n=1 Tax=Mycobacterium phage Marshawn TaxID=2652423 RepID=A0A5P8D780_9CAUD|nr:hypothetical protein I5H02_gp19 [Mycobacterium phage Marshawn]QFP94866.1 hypothetical protein SEA_MARSHAWN_80 [Mycobacterium phage Marshawn]